MSPQSRSVQCCSVLSLMALVAACHSTPARGQVEMDGDPEPVEEIVVSGKKREQGVQDLNDSVAVFTNAQLRDLTFTDVSELVQFTPNVQSPVSGEGDFSIRGINFRGENLSLTSNVGSFYVNGIFQSTLGIEAGPSGIFDVQQVEIYRGVQSTVQGRNALAGAIIIRTADPEFDWGVKGRVEVAEYDTQRYAAAINGQIIPGQVAFRASVDEFRTDGFLTNPAADIDNMDFDDTGNRRVKLLIEPEALEGFSALATYVNTTGIAGTGFGTNVANGPDFFARQTRPDITNPGLLNINTESFAIELSQQVNDRLTIEFVGTLADAREDSEPRFDGFDLDQFFDFATDDEEVRTAELRALWSGDRMDLLGGLYYFEQNRSRERDLGLPQLDIYFVEGISQKIDNYAVFFDGEYRLDGGWSLLFGARYDYEEFVEDGFTQFSVSGPIDRSALAINSSNTDYDAFLPKLGVRYEVSDDLSFSFVAQRGYRAGGSGIDGNNTVFEFAPEFTRNYELALRSSHLDGRLIINANAFYVDWEDQQVQVQVGLPEAQIFRTDNAGSSELYGLEIDMVAQLAEGLSLRGGLGYSETRFTNFVNAQTGQDFTGNSFSQAPELSGNLGLAYQHVSGLFANADGRFQTGSFSDPENFEEHRVGGHVVLNAKIGYRTDHWMIAAFARNLFDENYLLRIRNVAQDTNPANDEANVGAPQVFGLEIRFDY